MLASIYTIGKMILAIPWSLGGLTLIIGMILPWRADYLAAKIILFLIAAVALIIFAPAMTTDRIEITPTYFSFRTGGWWHPNVHYFSFKDVARVRVVNTTNDRGEAQSFMHVMMKSGKFDDVPMGDLFRAHKDDILREVDTAASNAN